MINFIKRETSASKGSDSAGLEGYITKQVMTEQTFDLSESALQHESKLPKTKQQRERQPRFWSSRRDAWREWLLPRKQCLKWRTHSEKCDQGPLCDLTFEYEWDGVPTKSGRILPFHLILLYASAEALLK